MKSHPFAQSVPAWFLVIGFLIPGLSVSTYAQLRRIESSQLTRDAHFGKSLNLYGETAILASPGHSGNALSRSGKTHFYRYDEESWKLEQEIIAPDTGAYDEFGASADIDDAIAIIGAPSNGRGKVYAYAHDGTAWQLSQEFSIPDQHKQLLLNLGFGSSVALSKNFLAVSAPGYSINASESLRTGAVFLYSASDTGWVFHSLIQSPDPTHHIGFGKEVVLHGNRLLVNAPHADGGAHESGAVYLFEFNSDSWEHTYTFVDPTSIPHELFGISMDLDDTQVIIGVAMYTEDQSEGPAGAAHIFQKFGDQWIRTGFLKHQSQERNDFFGTGVQIDGDVAVVTAPRADLTNTRDAGLVYTFRLLSGFWVEEQILTVPPQDIQSHMQLGDVVRLEHGRLMVSAHLWNGENIDGGSAYQTTLDETTHMSDPDAFAEHFEYYPNPTSGVVHIDCAGPEMIRSVMVYNLAGQTMKHATIEIGSSAVVDLDDMPAGTYFLYVETDMYSGIMKILKL